ncbi:ABC transporter, permease protein [Flavonifractor plautii ATCC 29863]|uniref:ABC transporter, permease protein n=2 Tax=Flavonifractor plautii TaxID=292800 RepID=G9YKW8_FLAPL|nr:ABC transporter, permease protein [Flavonifractor plautii ATCC 29863]
MTIFVVATFNFFLIRFMPGDPLEHLVGEEDYLYLTSAHPEVLEELEVEYGLDGNLWEQYTNYLGRLLHGDLGQSYQNKVPVLTLILQRLGRTFRLLLPAIALSAVVGIFLGAVAGWRAGSRLDRWISRLSLVVYSVPGYCLGMLGLMVFCFWLGVAPSGGMASGGLTGVAYWKDALWHMALPVGVLTVSKSAYILQMMRSSVVEAKDADYALVARTKGLGGGRILFRHVLPNAALPMITIITMEVGFIVSGSMMIEQIFNWDGMGLLVYRAIGGNDYPVLQGSLLVLTVCVVLANLLSDVLCALVDPRIQDGMWHE